MIKGLHVMVDKSGYMELGSCMPRKVHPVRVCRLADTGAQMTVISPALAERLGVKINEMVLINMVITVANGTSLEVLGGIPDKLSLNPDGNGKVRESHQLAYVVVGVNQLYICKAALCDLGLLPMRTLSAEKDVGDILAASVLPMETPPLKLLVDSTVNPDAEAETYKIEDGKAGLGRRRRKSSWKLSLKW